MHSIEDELFINQNGCILHDSRGFEAGSEEELQIVQNFVRRKSQEVLLGDRLHAIWFVPLYLQSQIHEIVRQVLHSDGQ
jgi:hypothetical protein